MDVSWRGDAMRHPTVIAGLVGLAAVLLIVTVDPGIVAAQDGTPAASPVALPVNPDPAACTVEPLTVDELLTRMGDTPLPATPGSMGAGGTPLPAAPFALPAGEPADPATVTAITTTLYDAFACRNTG